MTVPSEKEPLIGKTLSELEEIVYRNKLPSYTAKQIAVWLYKKDITSIDEMSNISKESRKILSEIYSVGFMPPSKTMISEDGSKKYLFPVSEGNSVESVYIPDKSRHTLCVSSQVGCKMGCRFCMTSRQGFIKNLSVYEIVNQLRSLPEKQLVTNIVFMGMGEPFDNYENVIDALEIFNSEYGFSVGRKKITVSTIGIAPKISLFLEKTPYNLAVSLHAPFEEERRKLIPFEKIHALKDILKEIRDFKLDKQRRITFEYILLHGFNDTNRHVNELAKILNGIRCRVNIMRFHTIPGFEMRSPEEHSIIEFRDKLNAKGITATIRASRGNDIMAACGQLYTLKK